MILRIKERQQCQCLTLEIGRWYSDYLNANAVKQKYYDVDVVLKPSPFFAPAQICLRHLRRQPFQNFFNRELEARLAVCGAWGTWGNFRSSERRRGILNAESSSFTSDGSKPARSLENAGQN